MPAKSQPKPDTGPTLSKLARSALDKANGNIEEAVPKLICLITSTPKVLQEIAEEAVYLASQIRLAEMNRAGRRTLLYDVNKPNPPGIDPDTIVRESLHNFTLRNGLKLCDATKEEILAQAEFYLKQGKDMVHKGRFLTLVAEAMTSRQKGKAIAADVLQTMWEETNVD